MLRTINNVKKYFIIVLIFLSFCSCNKPEKKDKKIITDNFSLNVPFDMESVYHINDIAKVQFQKPDEDLYFIVLQETKESFKNAIRLKSYTAPQNLLGYFKVVTEHFDEINEDFRVKDFVNTKINSCNAIVFSIYGKDLDNKKNTFYRYALIEDDKNFYQIMSWTNINYKDKLISKMKGIIYSFRSKSISRWSTN